MTERKKKTETRQDGPLPPADVQSDVPGLIFVDTPTAALDTFNVLLYGPPGSGKSVAAVTAPSPVLVVNAEGPNALAYARKIQPQLLEVRFDGRATLHQVLEHVRAGRDPKPRTVVIDSIFKVYGALLERLGGKHPKIQHYGEVNKDVADFVRALRDLPVNVVLVAHEKIDQNEDEAITRPLTGGQQLPEVLMGEVDVAAYCAAHRTENGVRYVGQLIEAKGRRAKDRSGALGAHRNLNLSEWLQVYRAGLAPDDSDLPWDPDGKVADEVFQGEGEGEQQEMVA